MTPRRTTEDLGDRFVIWTCVVALVCYLAGVIG